MDQPLPSTAGCTESSPTAATYIPAGDASPRAAHDQGFGWDADATDRLDPLELRRYPVVGLSPSRMVHPDVARWRSEQLLEAAIAHRDDIHRLARGIAFGLAFTAVGALLVGFVVGLVRW